MKTFFKIAFYIISVIAINLFVYAVADIISMLVVLTHPGIEIRSMFGDYGLFSRMLWSTIHVPFFWLLMVTLPWHPRAVSDFFGDLVPYLRSHISLFLLIAASPILLGSFTMTARILYVAGTVDNETSWSVSNLPMVLIPFVMGVCYSIVSCLLLFFICRPTPKSCGIAEQTPSENPVQNQRNETEKPILPVYSLPTRLRNRCKYFSKTLNEKYLKSARMAIAPVLDYYKETEKELPIEIRYRLRALDVLQAAEELSSLPQDHQDRYAEFEMALDAQDLKRARNAIYPVLDYWGIRARPGSDYYYPWEEPEFPAEIRDRIFVVYAPRGRMKWETQNASEILAPATSTGLIRESLPKGKDTTEDIQKKR